MNNRIFLLFLSLSISFAGITQNKTKTVAPKTDKPKTNQVKGTPFFETPNRNLGVIQEDAGKVKTNFKFTNIGKGDLQIKSVETTCGCTVPDWPKNPIKPGGTGVVTAEYDPLNRVGNFAKSLVVKTDGDPDMIILTITGDVYQEKMEVQNVFPFVQGHMRFTTYNLNMKPIQENKRDSIIFTVHNSMKREMFIHRIETPPHISTKVMKNMLISGEATDIIYYFDAGRVKDLGPHKDDTYILTSDDTLPKKLVTVKSLILQDFEHVPEAQKSNPPKIFMNETSHDFGEVYLGEVVTYEFNVLNKGKSDLLIRKVAPVCGCTIGQFTTEPIRKGKLGKITISFNARGLRGNQEKLITVYTNDPASSVITLKIKAKVVIPGVDPISGQ